jgi:N-glycosylase/DNA lyase
LNSHQSYTFPLPGKINDYKKIIDAKTGFRARYILEANNNIDIRHLNSLRNKPYKHAKDELKKVKGVGDKVADCILLFSLGFNQAFPVDTWIKKVIQSLYFNNNVVSNDRIREFGMDYFERYAGYAQQYLFMYSRNDLGTSDRLIKWKIRTLEE